MKGFVMSKLIIFIFPSMLPTFFSFDRCRDDCAKREEMRTPGEIGFWGGGAGGEPQRSSIWGGLARGPIP